MRFGNCSVARVFLGCVSFFLISGIAPEVYAQKIDRDAISRELAQMVRAATEAGVNDNCIRKSVYVNRLWEIHQDANHPFWARHGLDGDSPSINATRREFLEYIQLQVWNLNVADCPKRSAGRRVSLTGSAGGQFVRVPKRIFLGHEAPGATSPTLGLVQPSQNATGASGRIELKTEEALGPVPRFRVFFEYSYFDTNQNFPTVDPGAGNRIVFPGPEGGASGVSAGGYPLNIVRDAQWSLEDRRATGWVDIFAPTAPIILGDNIFLELDPFVGVGGGNNRMDEKFSGSVPGLNRMFEYSSGVDVRSVGARAGFDAKIPLDMGSAYNPILRLGGYVSATHMSASGTDSFTFTGVTPSQTNISKTKVGVGGGISAGLEVNLTPGLKFGAKVGYESVPDYGTIERDGNNPSSFKFENADKFDFMFGLTGYL